MLFYLFNCNTKNRKHIIIKSLKAILLDKRTLHHDKSILERFITQNTLKLDEIHLLSYYDEISLIYLLD